MYALYEYNMGSETPKGVVYLNIWVIPSGLQKTPPILVTQASFGENHLGSIWMNYNIWAMKNFHVEIIQSQLSISL